MVSASLSAHRDLQLAADLAAAQQVRSLSQLLDAQAGGLFLDFVHLGPTGNRLIAEHIAQDVTDVAHQTCQPASASPMVTDPATPQ